MGKYQRKSNRRSYCLEKLREAVREVESGKISGYSATKKYNIPRMTIMDHVKKRRGKSQTLGRNTSLSPDIEFSLASSLHIMEKYGFGLTRKEILQMVGDYINKNKLTTPFKNGVPGKDWFLAFKNRHSLSVKKPQAVEYARKRAIDPFTIYPYFDLLENTMQALNLKEKPSCIWNLDETSFSKDPAKTKIVGAKGYAATRTIASPGRDNTTVPLCASAAGAKIPPLIVYKGKNVWDTWTSSEAYPGTTYAASQNGWMETDIFESFFKKSFLPAVRGQRPVLLIYDGHSTHVGLNIIEEARKKNVTILKLPPHSSHVLQPLDITVMKPFKDRWDALLVKWQRLNVGSVMPKSEFAKQIGKVWSDIDPKVLQNGFRKAGIYPVNRDEIKENLFDSLKLRHWKDGFKQNVEDQNVNRNPHSLLKLTLNFFNQGQQCENSLLFEEIGNPKEPLYHSLQDHAVTFEDLLLEKVSRGECSPKTRRRKVAPGAEVITHDDVLEKKRKEQRNIATIHLKKNLPKDKCRPSKSSLKTTEDVINLTNMSRNDCQLRPFIAKDISNLPSCLRSEKSDSSKIKIISNILIKPPDTKEITNIRKGKHYTTAKKPLPSKENQVLPSKIKAGENIKSTKPIKQRGKHFDSRNLYENPKPGPSGLSKVRRNRRRRSSSTTTTSVSGSISYSDSDEGDIISENTILTDDDEESRCKISSSDTLDMKDSTKHYTPDSNNEICQFEVYNTGDDVLVRYHIRQKWTYYVGRIENTKIIDEQTFYSVRFYKTIKKPRLSFKTTKKVDREDVPEILIVKKVHLGQDPITLNYYFVSCDENLVYF